MLICYFIVVLLLLGHDGLLSFTLSLFDVLFSLYGYALFSVTICVVDAYVSTNINGRAMNNTSDFDTLTRLQIYPAVCCFASRLDPRSAMLNTHEFHGSRLLQTKPRSVPITFSDVLYRTVDTMRHHWEWAPRIIHLVFKR